MEVRDAETGETLVVPHTTPTKASASSLKLPPLATNPPNAPPLEPQPRQQSNNSPLRANLFPETQSTRPIGAPVDWQRDQQARVERAERRFQSSIRGLGSEVQRKDLDDDVRQTVEIQILEKMKAQYADQLRVMVLEEMERELAREVALRLELSAIGRDRLRKKYERERAFYKAQIERVRVECETSLVAKMAQSNLLR